MSIWMQLLFLAATGLCIWLGYRFVRQSPGSFSKENLGKSFYVMGILALGLIGFIALLVFLLKH